MSRHPLIPLLSKRSYPPSIHVKEYLDKQKTPKFNDADTDAILSSDRPLSDWHQLG